MQCDYSQIEIVGSLSGQCRVSPAELETVLALEAVDLAHNGVFTGKPETRIYMDDAWVVKFNHNRYFDNQDVARRWCELQLEKERDYVIYHPDRCWLITLHNGHWWCGNAVPRMLPLNQMQIDQMGCQARVELLVSMIGIYLAFTKRHGKRIDGALSNFAILDDQIIYLDDDIYNWDNFASFTAMLANCLRRSDVLGMNEQCWDALGGQCRGMLAEYSSEALDMVCEMLEGQVVGKFDSVKQIFLERLRPGVAYTTSRFLGSMTARAEPIGLVSDVHANLPAFDAALKYLKEAGVNRVMMLGDIVGYGPHPSECIQRAKEAGVVCIRGNHDHYVAHDGNVLVAAGIMAKWTLEWTAAQVTEEEKRWLGDMPVRLVSKKWMAVHGAPIDKSFFNGYVYTTTAEKNLKYMRENNIHICLHGHSHIQGVYVLDQAGQVELLTDAKINLKQYQAALVCPGSVGQPRTGRVGADGAIFYPDSKRLEFFTVQYDVESVAGDMRQAGFPEKLADRLLEAQ